MAIVKQAVLLIQLCLSHQLLAQKDSCSVKLTCRDCIQTENCIWCTASNYSLEKCLTHSRAMGCPQEHIYPRSIQNTSAIIEDLPFDDFRQVRPQRVSLKMRVGETYDLQIRYKQSQNYPVDLYYVMDLSASMTNYKTNLSDLGEKLAETMKALTSDFRLGFGSFVDKPTEPYVTKRWKSHCPKNILCEAPYSFKHIMKLESDAAKFKEKVKNAPLSVNIDWPEGGFDAIMQAVVCKEEIGWRNNARHLLIFSTDSAYHIAGDGKLGGIVEPNDMKCHLNKSGDYTHSLKFDYPSIGQIQQVVRDNNIYLIFVVTSTEAYIYRPLSNHIVDASLGFLDDKSGNVVEVIEGIYKSITDKVKLNAVAATDVVQVSFQSNCNSWSSPKETDRCTNVSLGHEVNFTATIKVVSCPKEESKWRQTVKIKISGLNQSIILDLEIIGKCECEGNKLLGFESNSKYCNHGGNKECGVCVCDDNHYGENCRCERTDILIDTVNNDQLCRESNVSVICSGHGDCLCGRCECDKGPNGEKQYSGNYCECDDLSCSRHNGLLCAGHGRCDCGTCNCDIGWQGNLCNCPTSTANCIAPDSDVICSGRGVCDCGVCSCKVNEKGLKYTGKYCEECPTCPAKRCDEFRPCVECKVFNSGTLNAQECLNCTVEILEVDYIKEEDENIKVCKMPDENCFLVFAYHTGNNMIWVQRTKECAAVVNALAMSLGMIGGIVLLGLLLLIVWKVVTYIHDEKEYAKFESERAKSKFDGGDNPLYKGPTTTIRNPMFPSNENSALPDN